MANMINRLFPPVVSTFMPAFSKEDKKVKISFSYPVYSTIDIDQTSIQVSVTRQDNNENALQDLTGILFYKKNNNENTEVNQILFDEYNQPYIEISISNFKGEEFLTDIFYKVQLRFDQNKYDEKEASYIFPQSIDEDQQKEKAKILSDIDKKKLFSEWSTVCLVRVVQDNTIVLDWEANLLKDEEDNTYSFFPGTLPITGRLLTTTKEDTTERLQSFKCLVLNENESIIYESETLSPEKGSNAIAYYLDSENFLESFELGKIYTLKIDYTTQNLYSNSVEYKFKQAFSVQDDSYSPYDPDNLDPQTNTTIVPKLDVDRGIVHFRIANSSPLTGYLHIKRTFSDRPKKKWETIDIISCAKSEDNIFEFQDNTVCPLRTYIYSYQYETKEGLFTETKQTRPILVDMEFASLVKEDKQLILLYGTQVTNFKNNVSRAKIDTLGGKYPKFIENAASNYKQFSLAGTISSESDIYNSFLSKEEYYGDGYQAYSDYLLEKKIKKSFRNDFSKGDIGTNNWKSDTRILEEEENKDVSSEESSPIVNNSFLESHGELTITTISDWMWERDFREKVIDWLKDGAPKLFRSATEGAIPVILTDISLTPKAQLSRRIWDFSATAYQVGEENSIADLIRLEIVQLREDQKEKVEDEDDGPSSPEEKDVVLEVGQLYRFSLKDKIYNSQKSQGVSQINLLEIIATDLRQRRILHNAAQTDPSFSLSAFLIKGVKVFFESPPHRYFFRKKDSGQITVEHYTGSVDQTTAEANQLEYFTVLGNPRYSEGIVKSGYKLYFNTEASVEENPLSNNSQLLFINGRGYYEYPSDVKILDLYLDIADLLEERITIEYIVEYQKTSKAPIDALSVNKIAKTVVGQYQDFTYVEEALGKKIRKKYDFYEEEKNENLEVISETQQRMNYWKGISLEATPYSLFGILYKNKPFYQVYTVGSTGRLSILNDLPVQNIKYMGRKLFPAPHSDDVSFVRSAGLKEYEFKPLKKGELPFERATRNENTEIYLNGKWIECSYDKSGFVLIKTPLRVLIDYWGEIIETKRYR